MENLISECRCRCDVLLTLLNVFVFKLFLWFTILCEECIIFIYRFKRQQNSSKMCILLGGLTAVMYTDTFQTIVMVIGSAVVMITSKTC